MKYEKVVAKSTKQRDLDMYISDLSSVVRDKEPKSAEKLFGRLLKESVGDKASRMLEFIPCVIDSSVPMQNLDSTNNVAQFFGFFNEGNYYTNARELLNWGWSMKEVREVIDFTNYQVFKCETPYFIYGQVSTHTQLTTVSHSQRYADCDRGYWKPKEVNMPMEQWNTCVSTFRPNELKELMRKHGITRKEILDRGVDMLQNRVFVIGGYTNNPNAWGHFLEQRLDSHTQLETRLFAEAIDALITR